MTFSPRTETYVNVSSLSDPYNITVTKPSGTVDGDILFCWIGWYAAVTIDSVPSGWTLLGEYVANTDRYALYYKIASGEGASWVWSFTATAKVRAVCSCYTKGDFDPSNPIDVVSNTAYRTSDLIVRAATMTVAAVNSPLVFWGGFYSTTTKSFAKPSVPTTGWVEDDDVWNTTPDIGTEVCSFIWSGSGATGAMDATLSVTATSLKHGFAVALNPPKPKAFADVGGGIDAFSKTITLYGKVFADVGAGSDVFANTFRAMPFYEAISGADAFAKEVLGFLFSDGFESGDFSAWTGTSGTPTVQSTIKHHGTYAALSDASNSELCYKTGMTALDPAYIRAYFYFDALPSSDTEFYSLLQTYISSLDCWVSVYNQGGTIKWRIGRSGSNFGYSTNSPVINTWYCVEVKVVSHPDVFHLYIDGVEVASTTGTATGTVNTLYIGGWDKTESVNVYWDCVVVDDAYIGVEADVTVKSFSDVSGGSDAFLNPYRAMPFADTGHGAEAISTPFRSMGFTDVSSGADVFALLRMLAFADVGGGADAFTKEILGAIAKAFTDAGYGSDVFLIPFKEMKFDDAGHGAEAFNTFFRSMGFADAGQGADVFALLRQLAFSDVGHGTDAFIILLKALGFSDVAYGADAFVIPYRAMGFSDEGHGADGFLVVFKTVSFSDAGYGSDAFAYYIPGVVKIMPMVLVMGPIAMNLKTGEIMVAI
jgi:hypothetical protein